MKWLILSNSPYLNGGFQTLTLELAKELLERACDVDFMCFQANPYADLESQYAERCRFHTTVEFNTRKLRPVTLYKSYESLKSIRPDVIFLCNSGVPDFLPFMTIARLAKVKHVIVHHGTDVDFPPEAPRKQHLGGFIPGIGWWRKELILSCRMAYRGVSLVLFNNNAQKTNWVRALKLTEAKCKLWYPPMDLSKFGKNPETRRKMRHQLQVENEFVIGCVGHLNRQKSFDVAVKALSVLKDRGRHAVLVIAGEGPERVRIETLARDSGVGNQLKLLGDRSDVPDLMNCFDVFCLPSTLINETLGIVILEAMATEVPVVVSDLPGPARLADEGRCGLTVPAGDYVALADAWCEVQDNANQTRKRISNALEQVRRCDRASIVDEILVEVMGSNQC